MDCTELTADRQATLTATDRKSLTQLEWMIEKYIAGFVEVGNALLAIRDGRLYRETHSTFELYCKERWEFQKAYAYRLIASAQVVKQLSPIGDVLPATESQARPLTTIPLEQVGDVWQEVIDKAPKDDEGAPYITAQQVQETVNLFVGGAQREATAKLPPGRDGRPKIIGKATTAMQFVAMAIAQLECVRKDDPERSEAIAKLERWIATHHGSDLPASDLAKKAKRGSADGKPIRKAILKFAYKLNTAGIKSMLATARATLDEIGEIYGLTADTTEGDQ